MFLFWSLGSRGRLKFMSEQLRKGFELEIDLKNKKVKTGTGETVPGVFPPTTRRALMGFLLLHGLIFLGVGYILSYTFPLFTIIHSGFGIFIYSVFLRAGFPRVFRSAVLGAIFSIALGLFFGDWLISNFYLSLIHI